MVNLDCALGVERTSDVEACHVVVLAELVHDHSVCLKLLLCPCWCCLDNGSVEGIEVDECVDT